MTIKHAAQLAVFAALTVSQPALVAAAQLAAAGIVVDSQTHKPLANARISFSQASAGGRKIEQVTRPDGQFSFAVDQPGKYTLQMFKPGYPDQAYRASTFANLSSAIVIREDQDTSHIVFEARRGAAINGVVKDENAEPVANALVFLFRSMINDGERKLFLQRQVHTNAAGEFRMAVLGLGNYYLCAMGRPWFADEVVQQRHLAESLKQNQERIRQRGKVLRGVPSNGPQIDGEPPSDSIPAPQYFADPDLGGIAYLTTFYPESAGLDDASPIRLEAGAELQVTIALPLSKAVNVTGSVISTSEPGVGRVILCKNVHEICLPFLDTWTQQDGKFKLENIPPGTYELVAASQASGASSWNVRQEVVVGGSDQDLALRPSALGAVSGKVVFEGERQAPGGPLLVLFRNEETRLSYEVGPGGNFNATRMPAGRYDVTASKNGYIAAYFTNQAGGRLPLTIDVPPGEPLQLDLTLTRAASAIHGIAEKAGSPQAGAFALLLPADASQHWAYRRDQSDSDGSFGMTTIPAGDYFLIALTDGAGVAYRDPKVAAILKRAAQAVHIEPAAQLDLKAEIIDSATLHLP
jgi:hypothetical protein